MISIIEYVRYYNKSRIFLVSNNKIVIFYSILNSSIATDCSVNHPELRLKSNRRILTEHRTRNIISDVIMSEVGEPQAGGRLSLSERLELLEPPV